MLPYLDIHSHRRLSERNGSAVECLSADEIMSGHHGKNFTSAGIHPWWTLDYTPEEIESFKLKVLEEIQNQKLWAIGETGIDRAYPSTLETQTELFYWHLDLSEKYGLPLIIHSVRAGSDFLKILKEKKPKSPWIFHDFRGNEVLMQELLRLHPHCYFSFGLSIDNSPQIRELLPFVPLEHVFLETDNQKHLDIHEIYIRAAEFMKIDLDLLKSQIWMNFKRCTKVVV